MKKLNAFLTRFSLMAVFVVLLQGCFKDTVESEYRYTIYQPIFKTLQQVRNDIMTSPPIKVSFPGKIYLKDKYIFVTETYQGIHIIDNANPSNPKNIGFIKIPSNVDMAVKNNTLYADMYSDLVTIDISNPESVKFKTVVPKIFVENGWYINQDKVIAGWDKKDTVVYSKKDAIAKGDERWVPVEYSSYYYTGAQGSTGAAGAPPASYGTGGSLARFTALQDRLYTVGNKNFSIFNIADDFNPAFVARKDLGWGVETIFPFKDNLFVGTTTGVRIFSLANLDNPAEIGMFGHVRRCDPVVANDKNAFATLRAGSTCGGNTSELTVLNIQNLTSPTLVKSYQLENPYGLGLDGTTLFICDGTAGLKIYDAADVSNLKLITTIKDIEPFDVIAANGLAIVVGRKGIYQYDYKDLNNIKLLSTTKLEK